MRLLWTKSKLPLSVLIRSVTGEDCSHFAIVLYEQSPGPIVFESNLLGTHPKFLQTFLKHCTIVHEVTIPLEQAVEDEIMDNIVKNYDDLPYDFGGAFYLGWRKLLFRIFRIPVPKINKWAKPDTFFCDELYEVLQVAGFPDIGVATGMETPHDVWEKVNNGS